MTALRTLPVWVAAFLGLSGQGVAADEVVARGGAIYAEFCQGCHGADKSGLVEFSRSREELQAILEGDTDQMPDFYGIFDETEVDAIFAYLSATADS